MAPHSNPNDEWINIEDLFVQCGGPTFDEYRKNPDKWRKGLDEIFESMDISTQDPLKRKRLRTQKYMWRNQYKCDSLEKLQRVAKEEGYTANDLEMCPGEVLIDGTNKYGRMEIIIQVWPKWEWQMMGKVSTNSD